mmetsp:Transcript_30516/g.71715  ORF Transcript_30516/g.71715 Transcript_30516/m.71715 type:complete len:289 (+) Transcript_30516:302-1168(+)
MWRNGLTAEHSELPTNTAIQLLRVDFVLHQGGLHSLRWLLHTPAVERIGKLQLRAQRGGVRFAGVARLAPSTRISSQGHAVSISPQPSDVSNVLPRRRGGRRWIAMEPLRVGRGPGLSELTRAIVRVAVLARSWLSLLPWLWHLSLWLCLSLRRHLLLHLLLLHWLLLLHRHLWLHLRLHRLLHLLRCHRHWHGRLRLHLSNAGPTSPRISAGLRARCGYRLCLLGHRSSRLFGLCGLIIRPGMRRRAGRALRAWRAWRALSLHSLGLRGNLRSSRDALRGARLVDPL